MSKKVIKPSSAAFCLGEAVCTQYDSGCLRKLLFNYWHRSPFRVSEDNQAVGATHEAFYARKIKSPVFGAEVPLHGEVNGIPYRGKADFIIPLKKL